MLLILYLPHLPGGLLDDAPDGAITSFRITRIANIRCASILFQFDCLAS